MSTICAIRTGKMLNAIWGEGGPFWSLCPDLALDPVLSKVERCHSPWRMFCYELCWIASDTAANLGHKQQTQTIDRKICLFMSQFIMS